MKREIARLIAENDALMKQLARYEPKQDAKEANKVKEEAVLPSIAPVDASFDVEEC